MKKIKNKPKGGENKNKAVKTASILILTLAFVLVLSGAASAGTPLVENQTGTVSGDLYVNTTDGWSSSTQGATNEVTQANTLPAYTSIDSAMVYVNVYSGSGTNNWPVRTTVKIDANGDGDYDDTGELLGTEDMNIPGSTDGTVYWLNDHCNRVYSDYQVWYNVTNLITCNNPTIYVKTESVGGDGYDGRIKLLALTVAYNDGDTDQVHYWVLNGQDWINSDTSPSTSTFNTSSFNGQVSSATLNTVALSGTDGTYTINGAALSGNLTETGSYYKENQWNITNQINLGVNTTLTYANVGSSLKMNLATLTIREENTSPPNTDFISDTINGLAPLTVHFTNTSTGNVTEYAWDFDNNGAVDSNDPNPTWTYNRGTYSVKLTVTGPYGTDTETKNNYITVIPENYATYLGGAGEENLYGGITVDSAGNIYITGSTKGSFLVTAGAYQTTYGGGTYDTFLTKFNSSGDLVFSTYIGGSGSDTGYDISTDNSGNIYIIGLTTSTNFPVTAGAYQTTYGGGSQDVFLTKFNSSGGLVYSTYLGGSGTDYGYAIDSDNEGNIYLTGYTNSSNFPVTAGAYKTTISGSTDAFLSKFNSSGGLVYSTYIGGSSDEQGWGIAVDNMGNIYVGGQTLSSNFPTTAGAYQTTSGGSRDVFLSKFNSSGGLVYSTYLGGSGVDYGYRIAMDNEGNACIVGYTYSTNFPVTTGAYQTVNGGGTYDGFLSEFNGSGALIYSTYIGGTGNDSLRSVAMDSAGNIYIGGFTTSTDIPTTGGAYQTTYAGGNDTILFKFNNSGAILYSTYLGGGGNDQGWGIAVDNTENVYLFGRTNGSFPTTTDAYQSTYGGGAYDDFWAKLATTQVVGDTEAPFVSASPMGDNLTSSVQVTLTATDNEDPNPTIFYTLDGSDPTISTGIQYTAPINIFKTTVLKFIAMDSAANISSVQTETYTDIQVPTISANPLTGTYTMLTQVILTAIDDVDPNPQIYYTLDGSDPTTSSTQYTGPINIATTTILKFIVVDASNNVSALHTETYTINDTQSPDVTATPAGGTYNPPKHVVLSATDNVDPNPKIYYTLDGTDPSTGSAHYTDFINITQNTVLKFIAADINGNVSQVQTETFNVVDTQAPTINSSQNGSMVTLTASDNTDPNPVIYYTNDGTDPTTNSTPYNGPINLPESAITTLKFIAVDFNGNTSSIQKRSFSTITGGDSWAGGRYYNGLDLETTYYDEGHIGIVVDNGGTTYHGGDPIYNLSLPADAIVLTARLYIAWTWYGYWPQNTVSFNGYNISIPIAHYEDGNDGQEVYDVTAYFNLNGTNTASIIPFNSEGNYGRTLVVIYQSASEPYRKIWLDEGYDILGHAPNTGFAMFDNVSTSNVVSAQITAILPSGDERDGQSILFNGQNIPITGTGGSDPSFNYFNVTSVLQNGTNEMGVTGGSYFSLQNAILTLTMQPADLTINNLQTNNPQVGTNSPITVTVTNNGGTDVNNFLVKLYDNNIQVAKTTITSLAAGASAPVNFNWTPATTGNHVLAVIADAGNQITESDETNNLVSAEVAVSPSAQSDLLATNLQLPVSPVIGTSNTVTATVTNLGTVDSSAFVVKLYDNNTQYATVNLTGLAAGASTDVTFNWLSYTSGAHNLSVIADANQQITEYNEVNNQISQQATVSDSTQPDLTITNLQIPASPAVAASSQVTATITNIGTVDSSAFVVKLYDNNTQIAKINLTGLAAGANTDVTFNWTTFTAGNHNLSVIADANQQISEFNENNNQISQQTTVSPATQPDLTVTDLQLPSNPVAGTTYQVTATVTNNGTDSGAFAVKLYDNNTQLGKINITSLAAGTSTQVTFNWTPTTGTHNLAIKADANNQISEYNENNNQITQQATVS